MTIEARPRGAEKTRLRPDRGASRQREAPSRPDDFLVVGLGASAGGLEALDKLFDGLPSDTGMAFVLIQHLDPTHKSMMVGLLAGHTSMKVLEAAEDMPIERDHVYLIPPGVYLSIRAGAFQLTKPRERHGARMPFDFFLRSLAEDCGERAVCAVGIVRKTACRFGGVRRRLRAWPRSPIAGIVFRRSSSSTPCGCTFASP